MNAGRDWMGEFVVVSPEVWVASEEGFTFHDAVFAGVEFPERGDPMLLFDALVSGGHSGPRLRVVARLIGTTTLNIHMPRDWVFLLEIVANEEGCDLRWIDQETGYPMIEATASRIEITLPAEVV